MGSDGMGWDSNQKCPSKFFILCKNLEHKYIYLYTKQKLSPTFLWISKCVSSWWWGNIIFEITLGTWVFKYLVSNFWKSQNLFCRAKLKKDELAPEHVYGWDGWNVYGWKGWMEGMGWSIKRFLLFPSYFERIEHVYLYIWTNIYS